MTWDYISVLYDFWAMWDPALSVDLQSQVRDQKLLKWFQAKFFSSWNPTQNNGLPNLKSANQNNFGYNLNMSKIKHRKIGALAASKVDDK